MAIIYSYPEIPDVQGGDLLLISDTGAPNKPTRSVDIDDLAAYIGTVVGVVQNLQSVLTVGNTYVSPDGYGTFTLNNIADNNGDIKYVNTDEGWGYFLNAEEGLFFTDGTGGQTGRTGIGLDTVFIGNSNHIGIIRSANITADRTYELPNASGTIALENLSNWYSVTGSRGLGNLLVKIGDYDNSGNGTFLSIDDADQSMTFTKGGVVESKFVFTATQDRDYTFPNADGTIALTSDIPTPGPSGSGTTNYTARWTNASTLGIGALYDNGTNVGIGTANPTQKLEVNGTVLLSTLPNNNGRLCLGSVSTNLFSNAASGHLYVSTNGSTRMTILNSGNVGIGTTSPSNLLHVEGTVKVNRLRTIASGSQSNPVIYIDGDSDTGLWRPTSNTLAITTGGTNALIAHATGQLEFTDYGSGTFTGTATQRLGVTSAGDVIEIPIGSGAVDGSGTTNFATKWIDGDTVGDSIIFDNGTNVGIGTISPSEKLDVEGNARVGQNNGFYINNQNVGIKRDSNDLVLGGFGNVIIKSSNTTVVNQAERMRITSAGNVGIGTTNPTANLQLGSFGTADQEFRIESSGNSYFSVLTTNGVQKIYAGGAGTQSNEMAFYTSNSGAEVEAMRITSTGNIGIGTTSPAAKLHLSESASGGNPSFILQDNARSGAATLNYILLKDSSNTNQAKIGYLSGLNADLTLQNLVGNTSLISSNQIKITAGTNTLFESSGSEKMRITSTGNVGIGTTAPTTKLQVNGDVRIYDENELYFGGTGSVPHWEIKASGTDLIINDTGTNVGSVLFNNDEGVVLPRLTTTEINAISLPNTGLTVYNTTLNTLCFYNGSSWQKVSHANM